jgi:hypothetical protein
MYRISNLCAPVYKYDTESERDIHEYCASDCSLEVVKVANYLQNHVSNMWEMLCTFCIVE